MALPPGTRLGTYEIVAPLGAGGMGEVYRAKDLRLHREIALKVLPAGLATDAERLARFEREARTVAGLNHPNIVTLHSIEDDGDVRFLTMELVEGKSLDKSLVPGGLPIPKVIDMGVALADALVAAHERGVVHRDLKPANVMLTKDGRVKVLDFGLAKLAATDSSSELTQAATVTAPLSGVGHVLGTVPYMAPEQIRGEAVDARTDLFALGIVFYELASGKRPFVGETQMDIGHAILREAPKPLADLRGDVPAGLERIIDRCLEKNPRERFQTALDVSNELRRLRKEFERSGSGTPARPAPEPVASIAVLPFVNRSASAEDEYFSDGLADELLNVLSKIKGLRVTARTSSLQFKGSKDDAPTIGRKLNVATLLEGSVRKARNRIRVSVQLVSAADSSHLWSETYDRTLEDIFAVQDDIAQSVVRELRTALLGETPDSGASGKARAEVAVAARERGQDFEAHRLYLQGKYFLDRLTQEDATRALDYLDQAVRLDPTHVSAWLELSRAHGIFAGRGWGAIGESHRMARETVDRALALAPHSAEAHARLANIQIFLDWKWEDAERSLRSALLMSPNNDPALRSAGTLAALLGRFDEAEAYFRRAIEQDPLNAFGYQSLGNLYRQSGRGAEAERAFRKVLELAPQRAATRALLALSLLQLGRGEEAMVEAQREAEDGYRLFALTIVQHEMARGAESDATLRELIASHAEDMAFQIAEAYGARGEADPAFEWLERAYAYRDTGMPYVKVERHLRSLHGDPRWGSLLRKMGFELA